MNFSSMSVAERRDYLAQRPVLARVLVAWAELLAADTLRPVVLLGSQAWRDLRAELELEPEGSTQALVMDALVRAAAETSERLPVLRLPDPLLLELVMDPILPHGAVVPLPPAPQPLLFELSKR